VRTIWTLASLALLAACATNDTDDAADTTAAAATDTTAMAGAMDDDPDRATEGGGVPSGYLGQVDPPRPGRTPASISGAQYTAANNRWEVRTGPAHIVYAAKDTASGNFTASVQMEQLENPAHPEAFGIFVGGQNLDQPEQQRYTYFLVRGGGEIMVRVREGTSTRDVIAWRPAEGIPRADASGKASYELGVQVTGDSVRFLVNDREVASVPKASLPTDGVVGMRINHNLHVMVAPVEITRG
jgi:hypothetical protein